MRMRLLVLGLVAVLMLGACGDDNGGSSSDTGGGGAGTSAASGETTSASGSSGGSGSGTTAGGASTTEATTTTTPNPVVSDSQTNTGLVQTAVQMKFLAATVEAGQATPDA